MTVRRCADSVYLQYIWDSLEAPSNNQERTFEYVLKFIQREKDPKCDRVKLLQQINNSIRDKCVIPFGTQYKRTDWNLIQQSSRHDSYCFECHLCGPVIDCPTCFRVFHERCLARCNSDPPVQFNDELCDLSSLSRSPPPPSGPCPLCRRLNSTTLANNTTHTDLRQIFSIVLGKMRPKNHWQTLATVGYVNDGRRNEYFTFKEMNTRLISEKLRSAIDSYPTRTHLLVDLDLLIHNAVVIYGCKAEMTNTARQLRSLIQKELFESSLCVDCFLRTKGNRPDARQNTEACRKAHKVLWFQFSSWSFTPCKVLAENSEGYEVICFDGRRERHFVPSSRAVQMTFTATQLGMRVTATLKRALDDAQRYCDNQRKRTPDFGFVEGLKYDTCTFSPANSVCSTVSGSLSQASSSRKTAPKRRPEAITRKAVSRPKSKPVAKNTSKTEAIFCIDRPAPASSPSNTLTSCDKEHRPPLISTIRRRPLSSSSSSSSNDNISSISSDASSVNAKYVPGKPHHVSTMSNNVALPESSSDYSTTPAIARVSPNISASSNSLPPTRLVASSANFFNRRNNVSDSDSASESSPLESYSPPPKKRPALAAVDPLISRRHKSPSSSSATSSNSEDSEGASSLLESGSPPGRRLFSPSSKSTQKTIVRSSKPATFPSKRPVELESAVNKVPPVYKNNNHVINPIKKGPPARPLKRERLTRNQPSQPVVDLAGVKPAASNPPAASSVSSVSPAALSSSSGMGSSVNGNAPSPGELIAGAGTADSNRVKAIEDRVRKEMMTKLEAVTRECDLVKGQVKELKSTLKHLKRQHEDDISFFKSKTWCAICQKEAIYYCCVGIGYCSASCQNTHWNESHSNVCERIKANGVVKVVHAQD